MKLLVRLLVITGFLFALPLYGGTEDLSSAYKRALEYDARLGMAQADNQAYREEMGKARSQFRPSVRWSAARGRNATQFIGKPIFGRPNMSSDFYNTANYGVSVRQSLFNASNIAEYKQSKAIVAKSDAELKREEEGLIVRLTEAYCNALYAEDNLEFSRAQLVATEEQLKQAKRRFEKGFGTITAINEAQASYDMALAEGLEIVNSVEFSRRELEDITGLYPDQLCRLVPEKLCPSRPDPESVEAWIELGRSVNPAVIAARQELQVARREIEKQRGARYPTIDLVGGRNYSESENNYSIGSTYDTYSVSLQMSVPMYTGGYVSAAVRQAHARWVKAGEQLSWQERGVESDVRKYYNSVVSSIAQIHAYEQAVKSYEIALIGTKKGFEAGFRSNVEVLDAQQKLLASQRNLAKARYQYILNRLMLKQSAGVLAANDVDEVNSLLGEVKR